MRNQASRAIFGASSIKLVIVGFTAVMLAGCSDSIERFSANYSNPSDTDPVYTASIPQVKHKYIAPAYRAPQRVADAGSTASEAIVQSPIAAAPVAKAPVYDYAKSYAKTYKKPQIADAGPVAPAPIYVKPKYRAPVIQNDADTEVIADSSATTAPLASKPHNLSLKKPLLVNAPVKKTLAPVQPQVAVAEEDPVPPEPKDIPKKSNQVAVAKGDTLFSLGRKFNVSPFAIAEANGLPKNKALPIGKLITIPTKSVTVAKVAPKAPEAADTADAATDAGKTDVAQTPTKKPVLALLKEQTEKIADTAPAPVKPVAIAAAPSAATPSDAQLTMRWPVRGKVISGFGSKPNGMKNEGINIAVPEGTSVQAAEGGVVAYAGNELKGYGNLVLIRHANGYVTAYAHTKEILVKKGATVKRGDVIAKSGATGAVQSPQLHFEVRKGATAMDPNTFLNSASAAN